MDWHRIFSRKKSSFRVCQSIFDGKTFLNDEKMMFMSLCGNWTAEQNFQTNSIKSAFHKHREKYEARIRKWKNMENLAQSGKLLRRCKQWPFHFCCLCVRVFVCSEPYSPILMFYFIFDDFPEINGNCSTDKQSFHSYFKWVVGICFSLASRIFH